MELFLLANDILQSVEVSEHYKSGINSGNMCHQFKIFMCQTIRLPLIYKFFVIAPILNIDFSVSHLYRT